MSERLTDAQMTVLRALEKLDTLPEEGHCWAYPTRKTFNAFAALSLCLANNVSGRPQLAEMSGSRAPRAYRLTPAGRTLIAKLKAEGTW